MTGGRGRSPAAPAALGLAAVLGGGAACAAPAPDLIDCATIPKAADERALAGRFGRGAVQAVDLDGAEGTTERGTAVFARDPARRLDVFWSDAAHRRGPASVVIRDRSRWRVRLPGGGTLGLGASLREVEAANGRPFTIAGFYWDYGGFVRDWRGGALPRLPGGCTLTVRFNPDPRVGGAASERVSGEKAFASSSAALRAVSPAVSVLTLDRDD